MEEKCNNLFKGCALLILFALFFISCDELLPKKKVDDKIVDEAIDEAVSEIFDENDVSDLYAEHDIGRMTVYEFYYERYFGDGNYQSDRFLSERLRCALEGISTLERRTGNLILGYDPFIKAQDICFAENQYYVERNGDSDWFIFSYDNTHVQLHLMEENGEYLIDDVKLYSGETITELYEKEKRNAYK